MFDEHHRWYRVRVHAGTYKETSGIVVLPGSWTQVSEGSPAEHYDPADV